MYYFDIDEKEVYNDLNKLYDAYRRNNNFSGFLKYYDSIYLANELYFMLTGNIPKDKHTLSYYDMKKIDKFDRSKIDEFFNYSKNEINFWIKCFDFFDKCVDSNLPYKSYIYEPKKIFNKKDTIEIVKDFYSQFKKYDKIVDNLFENNCIADDVKFYDNEHLGATFFINALDKNYIVLNEMDKGLCYLSCLVHEIGHVIDKNISSKINYNTFKNNYLQEVSPLFFQLIFNDYLKKNKIVGSEADLLLSDNFYYYYKQIKMIQIINSLNMESMDERGYVLCSQNEALYEFPFYNNIIYSLGNYFALHLKYLYYNDRDKFNNIYEYFVKNRGVLSSENLALSFGFGEGVFESGTLVKDYIEKPFLIFKKK